MNACHAIPTVIYFIIGNFPRLRDFLMLDLEAQFKSSLLVFLIITYIIKVLILNV